MMGDRRLFPMLDGPPIPWKLARAIHAHLYRHDQSLERMAERGGFGWREVAFMWGISRDHDGKRNWRTTDKHRAACIAEIAETFCSPNRKDG